jgi:hypothetical protein
MKEPEKKKQFSEWIFDILKNFREPWLHIRTGYLIGLRSIIMNLKNLPISGGIFVHFLIPIKHLSPPSLIHPAA